MNINIDYAYYLIAKILAYHFWLDMPVDQLIKEYGFSPQQVNGVIENAKATYPGQNVGDALREVYQIIYGKSLEPHTLRVF